MIVGTSCKTSYNVLSYSYVIIWWLGQSGGRGVLTFGGGGVVQKRESSDLRPPEVGISEILVVLWAGYFSVILCHCDESV